MPQPYRTITWQTRLSASRQSRQLSSSADPHPCKSLDSLQLRSAALRCEQSGEFGACHHKRTGIAHLRATASSGRKARKLSSTAKRC
jgi:hypothetical protein